MMVPPVWSEISRAPITTRYFMLYVSDLHMDLLHKAAKKMVFVNE